ncbi:hypothetical protein [Deinococcus cellulosilyticus]|uniref:XRE family transcriptional regulator n=1 Tax=Deinococcus cellulosilyticus (strain DSM 18568 / NBRC 106333 / KACC 11606 / 5516J-15) TaxID=1223518 RepID=A0A511N049_DEIC1|nr:hypothetical protein [Deinococcus cellulosilyticus]GEM46245.1 hypothetical protein DC3_18800 [Deinococcus cellulosilyticus NBRC 106333 = KACC 11606]
MRHLSAIHDPQLDLARYLQLEMHTRGDTLKTLCETLQIGPEPLKQVLAGQLPLTAVWIFRLAQHWEISAGLLWHWQQDILASKPFFTPAQASD